MHKTLSTHTHIYAESNNGLISILLAASVGDKTGLP